jgi:hypothetical protein
LFLAFYWPLCWGPVASFLVRRGLAVRAAQLKFFASTEVRLERTSSRTEVIVRFTTIIPVRCEFTFWAQKEGTTAPADAEKQACSNIEATSEFNDIIRGIDPELLYYVAIEVWPEEDRNNSERLLIAERSTANLSRDLFVARFNVPLRTTEIHRFHHDKEIDRPTVDLWTRAEGGCKTNTFAGPSNYSPAHDNLRISTISSNGFGTAKAVAHTENKNVMRMHPGSLQNGENWNWSTLIDGLPENLRIRAPLRLNSIRLVSEESLIIEDDPQLGVADRRVLKISKESPLRIEWQSDSSSLNSQVRIQIGYNGQAQSQVCIAAAAAGHFEVNTEILSAIPKATYDITVSLLDSQYLVSDGSLKSKWLFQSHDWKLARIEVL